MQANSDLDFVMQYLTEPHVTCDFEGLEPREMDIAFPISPPYSEDACQSEPEYTHDTAVTLSTTFHLTNTLDSAPPDTILLTSDSEVFYLHRHRILDASENGFNTLLSLTDDTLSSCFGQQIVSVPEHSDVIDIILYSIYDMRYSDHSYNFDILFDVFDTMVKYGIPIKKYVAFSTPLYSQILSQAPIHPLEAYALAASRDLYDLAVPISSHLLSCSLSNVTDELASRIGPVYLRRLLVLHMDRTDALKRFLVHPPRPHAENDVCDFMEQKKLARAWSLAASYLAWDGQADVSTRTMEETLLPLEKHLVCDECRTALKEKIRQLVIQWSMLKRTI